MVKCCSSLLHWNLASLGLRFGEDGPDALARVGPMALIEISLCLCLIKPMLGRAMVQNMAKGLRYAVTGPAGSVGTSDCIDTLLHGQFLLGES